MDDSFAAGSSFLASGLYEEEERDGWTIAPEVENNPKSLDCSTSRLTVLPADLFSNPALTSLNLSNNSLHYISEEIGCLSLLEVLDLSQNQLEGENVHLPLPRLRILQLSRNRMQQPPVRLHLMSHLQILDMSHNRINQLPSGIQHLVSLKELYLRENQLTSLPQEVFLMGNLEKLDANSNQISTIQDVVFPASLQFLDLGHNRLPFVHPSQFSCCENLEFLRLSSNEICFLDEELFLEQLPSLKELHLANNHLRDIPFSIGTLVEMVMLNLSNNSLTELPSSIGHLVDLRSLYLTSNFLQFLPRSIGNLKKLELLDLSYNQLTAIPPTVGHLEHLVHFKLGYNLLEILPLQILDLHRLEILDLSGNEDIRQPPPDVCEEGLQAIKLYLETIPASVEDLQEGWEIVEPTTTDIRTEFGLTSSDVAPYLKSYSCTDVPPHSQDQQEDASELPRPGWISSTLQYLSRSIWGETPTAGKH